MASVAASPLVSTDWLGKQLHSEAIRVTDCRFYLTEPERGREEYLASHIPGASYFSLDDDLTAREGPGRHPLPNPDEFAASLRRSGIGNGHTVVVYDQGDSSMAARMWWMLRSLGHTNVVVLDGGWTAWTGERRSITAEIPRWEPQQLSLAEEWAGTIDREAISAGQEDLQLLDSRAAERHRGETEPIDPIAGHIPGSINVPYQGNTDPVGRFLPVARLRDRFRDLDSARPVVCYCGSGVTACNNILAMAIVGITEVMLYPGSWSDWCTSGGPVATGGRE